MKIAIPVAIGTLSMHFGHCEKFVLVDVDPEAKAITATTELEAPPHEPGLLPRWLAEQSADLIIAGGMGQRAQSLFEGQGIVVVVGAPSEEPEILVQAYLSGSLQTGMNACDH
ncbi:MAG: NifB/NifX family molybdenum-iron cluster-binding protein [Verrucomicrobia bacterium]|nr:NifB/NifX family molybdenum-iron cluster-binding protein [Verrucomicrobiota bacterium]